MAGLRLLSWNVRDLLGDPLAVHRVIRSARPDLVCLQEFPRRLRPWPRLAALAERTGLFAVAGGRPGAGCALLAAARVQVLAAQARALPVQGLRARPRGLVDAVLRLPAGPSFALAGIHLPLEPAQRVRHARAVHDLLARQGLPAVVAGDLNEPPGGPAWQALEPLVADPWPRAGSTFPARLPSRRIDAVLVGAGVRAEPADWAPDPQDVLRASDHLPVLAVLALPGPVG